MTDEKAAVVVQEDFDVNGTQIAHYGQRAELREIQQRLLRCHHQAREVGAEGMLAVAQTAIAMGASPLPWVNEIHVWLDNKGKIVVQLGINFYRRRRNELGGLLWRVKPRLMRPDENEAYMVEPPMIGAFCEAVRRDDMTMLLQAGMEPQAIFDAAGEIGLGTGNPKSEYPMKGRPPVTRIFKRAEVDLYRKLFPHLEKPPEEEPTWKGILLEQDILPYRIASDPGAAPDEILARNGVLLGRTPDDFEGFGDEPPTTTPVMVYDTNRDHPMVAEELQMEDEEPTDTELEELAQGVDEPWTIPLRERWIVYSANDAMNIDHYSDPLALFTSIADTFEPPLTKWPQPLDDHGWDMCLQAAINAAQDRPDKDPEPNSQAPLFDEEG
jgi:hypothetical protein